MSKVNFSKIASQIEKDGFDRGYRQAVKDMRRALGISLDDMLKAHQEPDDSEPEGSLFLPESKDDRKSERDRLTQRVAGSVLKPTGKLSAEDRVFNIIKAIPGQRGAMVVASLAQTGSPVKERTVRTALWRLKNRKLIELRGHEWYVTPHGNEWYATPPSEEKLPPP